MLCVASLDPSATEKKCSVSKKTDQLRPSRGEFKCHLAWAERINHPAQAGASVHAHTHRPRKPNPTEKPHPREIFWSMFPFQNFQPGFPSSCFIPLPVGPNPASKKKKKKKWTLSSTLHYSMPLWLIQSHLPVTPHFHFSVQTHSEKYQQPDSSGRLRWKW